MGIPLTVNGLVNKSKVAGLIQLKKEGIKKTSVGDRFYITIDVIRHLQGQCKSVKCAIKLE